MKKLLFIVPVALVALFLLAQDSAPDPLENMGGQLINALRANDFELVRPLIFSQDDIEAFLDDVLDSSELRNETDDVRAMTVSLMRNLYDLLLPTISTELAAQFDSVRAYAADSLGVDWSNAAFESVECDADSPDSLYSIGSVRVNFTSGKGRYTLWVGEISQVNGQWKLSAYNLAVTPYGAPEPGYGMAVLDMDSWASEGGEELGDDSWADSTSTDDSWESEPSTDPRSKKAIEQESGDSWEDLHVASPFYFCWACVCRQPPARCATARRKKPAARWPRRSARRTSTSSRPCSSI